MAKLRGYNFFFVNKKNIFKNFWFFEEEEDDFFQIFGFLDFFFDNLDFFLNFILRFFCRFFWIFLRFWDVWDFFLYFLLWFVRFYFKVTKVTTEHQKWPKISQNSKNIFFSFLKGKKILSRRPKPSAVPSSHMWTAPNRWWK